MIDTVAIPNTLKHDLVASEHYHLSSIILGSGKLRQDFEEWETRESDLSCESAPLTRVDECRACEGTNYREWSVDR